MHAHISNLEDNFSHTHRFFFCFSLFFLFTARVQGISMARQLYSTKGQYINCYIFRGPPSPRSPAQAQVFSFGVFPPQCLIWPTSSRRKMMLHTSILLSRQSHWFFPLLRTLNVMRLLLPTKRTRRRTRRILTKGKKTTQSSCVL